MGKNMVDVVNGGALVDQTPKVARNLITKMAIESQ